MGPIEDSEPVPGAVTLDELIPVPHFAERHERRIEAPPDGPIRREMLRLVDRRATAVMASGDPGRSGGGRR